jgi:hypothetical protein
MGSCSSKKPENFSIEEEYRKLNLPMPDPTAFEGSFEKEAFFTVNVFRSNPKLMIPFIKDAKSKTLYSYIIFQIDNKLYYKGKSWSALIKEIEKLEENSLPMIGLDTNAMEACK